MLDTGGSLMRGTTPDGKSKTSSEKRLKRSRSTDGCFSLFPAGFRLPDQVLIFPVLEKLEEGVAQWDFYLLTEEEVRIKGGGRGVVWVTYIGVHPSLSTMTGHLSLQFNLCTLTFAL